MLRTGYHSRKAFLVFTYALLYCGTSINPLWSQSKGNEIGFQALELEAKHGFALSPEDMQFYRNLIDKTVQAINDVESVDRTDGYSKGEAITILQTIDTTLKELDIRGEYVAQSELYSESIRDRNFDCDKYVLTYLTIAQIAGLPLQAIVVPEHIFVKWKDSQLEFYWEATSGGEIKTMEWIVPQDNKYQAAHDIKLKTLTIPEYLATVYMNIGLAYSEIDNHQSAIEVYSNAISICPLVPDLYLNRANSYAARGQHESAIKDYSTALRLNPFLDDAYSGRAQLNLFTEQYQKSIDDCTEALELNKDNIEAHYIRGKAYLQLDELDKAKDDLDRMLELDPNSSNALFELSEISDKKSEVKQRLIYLTEAIKLDTLFMEAYYNRAVTYHNMGEYQKAVKDWNKVLLLAPKNVEAMENRGLCYDEMGQKDKAITDYLAAIKGGSKEMLVFYNLGVLYYNRGMLKEACEIWSQGKSLGLVECEDEYESRCTNQQ